MKKVRMTGGLLAVTLLVGFTGCGKNEIPDLTKEEMQMISEFTAFTMMKYDAGNRSRLVDLTELGMAEHPGNADVPDRSDAEGDQTGDQDRADEESATSEAAGMDPVDETPVVDAPGQEPADSYTAEEVLGLPEGVSLVYAGMKVCDAYPEEESDYFSLTATDGKKLLAIHFQIANTTGQEQTVNILDVRPSIRIMVNDTLSRTALSTMLEDDMVFFEGEIPAGSSEQVVLLIEVDEGMAEDITSLSVNMSHEDMNCYMKIL